MLPSGPRQSSHAPDPTPNDGEIHVLPVAGNVYMLTGDGGNIAVQVGPQGAFVVDTGTGRLSSKVIEAISKISAKPIQFIVNTSFHADHTGGNKKLQAAGVDPSVTGSFFSLQSAAAWQGATVIGQQNVQNRMEEEKLEQQQLEEKQQKQREEEKLKQQQFQEKQQKRREEEKLKQQQLQEKQQKRREE